MKLSATLVLYRREKGLTQKEMAARLDISREYYWRLENGNAIPSVRLLERICRLTSVSVQAIFQKNNGETQANDFLDVCKLCLLLKKEDRKEIERLIKRLARK